MNMHDSITFTHTSITFNYTYTLTHTPSLTSHTLPHPPYNSHTITNTSRFSFAFLAHTLFPYIPIHISLALILAPKSPLLTASLPTLPQTFSPTHTSLIHSPLPTQCLLPPHQPHRCLSGVLSLP